MSNYLNNKKNNLHPILISNFYKEELKRYGVFEVNGKTLNEVSVSELKNKLAIYKALSQ